MFVSAARAPAAPMAAWLDHSRASGEMDRASVAEVAAAPQKVGKRDAMSKAAFVADAVAAFMTESGRALRRHDDLRHCRGGDQKR